MKVTKEQIYDALRAVVDPEVGFDVVSLGLIYDVAVDDENNAKVTMTLSTQSCPLHEMMVEWVRAGAESVEGVGEVRVVTASMTRSPVVSAASSRARMMSGRVVTCWYSSP